jgi:plasmid stabilization system protein ParE
MAYQIFWTPIAVQDLRDICDCISRDNPVAAQRMGEELIKQSEAMAVFPQSGRLVKKDPLIRETLGRRTSRNRKEAYPAACLFSGRKTSQRYLKFPGFLTSRPFPVGCLLRRVQRS